MPLMIFPYVAVAIDDLAARLHLRDPNRRAVAAVADTLDSAEPTAEIVCDLATATGKTYIAAGLIDYLAAAGVRNVLIVCPGTTILTKTVNNFTPGHEIGSAALGQECVSTCRSRWSPYH